MIPSAIREKVLSHIDAEELIDFAAELVRINSVWDPAAGTNEQAVAQRVADWARTQGFEVQVNQVAPNRPNIIISWPAHQPSCMTMRSSTSHQPSEVKPSGWGSAPTSQEAEHRS